MPACPIWFPIHQILLIKLLKATISVLPQILHQTISELLSELWSYQICYYFFVSAPDKYTKLVQVHSLVDKFSYQLLYSRKVGDSSLVQTSVNDFALNHFFHLVYTLLSSSILLIDLLKDTGSPWSVCGRPSGIAERFT